MAGRLREADIEPLPAQIPMAQSLEVNPASGIWLMPDNKSPGELEDFIASMIPSEDPVWPLSKDYIDAIPEEHREFKEGKIQRAKVHAWLAAREEPD